jgi:hypothetical protein
MTLFDVDELTGYWTDHPPLHLLVAAYLGRQRAKPTTLPKLEVVARASSKRAEQLLADLGPALVNGDVHAGLGSVSLDFAELRHRANPGNSDAKTSEGVGAT